MVVRLLWLLLAGCVPDDPPPAELPLPGRYAHGGSWDLLVVDDGATLLLSWSMGVVYQLILLAGLTLPSLVWLVPRYPRGCGIYPIVA